MALPAFGILSEIIPVFSRKPIFGCESVAGSTVAIAFLSLGVWAHPMFTVGLGHATDLVFVASSLLIAVPTRVKVLNWSATMVGGRLRLDTPMLFCVAALVQVLCAGLTGVSHAVVAVNGPADTFAPARSSVAVVAFIISEAGFFAVLGLMLARSCRRWRLRNTPALSRIRPSQTGDCSGVHRRCITLNTSVESGTAPRYAPKHRDSTQRLTNPG